MEPDAVLLDTCAAIWLSEGANIDGQAVEVLKSQPRIYLSPISVWEMGMLVSKERYFLSVSVMSWFNRLLQTPGAVQTKLSLSVLIDSSFLPGSPPRDPFDRLMIATAREYGCRIMTRDGPISRYAKQGFARVVRC